MPQPKDPDLNGSAPESSEVVLLLIDVISDWSFPDGDALLEQAVPMAQSLAALKRRAKQAGVPVVYVNDNWGRWRSDFHELVRGAMEAGGRAREVTELLQPSEDDYFVLKPKHSAFFGTTLDTLLEHFGARRLILTGTTGEQCVFFTGADAHMRDYEMVVPSDCVVSVDPEENHRVLERMERLLHAEVIPSEEIDFDPGAGHPD